MNNQVTGQPKFPSMAHFLGWKGCADMEKEMELISREAAIDEMAELQGRASTKAEMKVISKAWKRLRKLPTASKHDEFEKALVDLFAPIMECEINHPKYEETVADIIHEVMDVYDKVHPAERKDNG